MIEILQETKTSVVCVKPVGIAAQGMDAQALPQLLAAQLGCEVYPVHRLDQAVGGVMVYAKTAKEAARLTQSMGEGGMQKTYLAVLTGCPEETSGTLEDLLFHDRVKNKTYVVRRPRGGVKKAKAFSAAFSFYIGSKFPFGKRTCCDNGYAVLGNHIRRFFYYIYIFMGLYFFGYDLREYIAVNRKRTTCRDRRSVGGFKAHRAESSHFLL